MRTSRDASRYPATLLGSSSHSKGAISKLYNPDSDELPLRRTAEPERHQDVTGDLYPRGPRSQETPRRREERIGGSRQSFDHRIAKTTPSDFLFLHAPMVHPLPKAPLPPNYLADTCERLLHRRMHPQYRHQHSPSHPQLMNHRRPLPYLTGLAKPPTIRLVLPSRRTQAAISRHHRSRNKGKATGSHSRY
jgi:hypothetical protein